MAPCGMVPCKASHSSISRYGHADVNDDCRAYELIDAQLINRFPPFKEMDRRIDMRPAVLCRRETVGRVVPAPVGMSFEYCFLVEGIGSGPVQCLLRVGMAQVHPVPPGEINFLCAGQLRHEASQSSQYRESIHTVSVRFCNATILTCHAACWL